jgi:hypothetical protein
MSAPTESREALAVAPTQVGTRSVRCLSCGWPIAVINLSWPAGWTTDEPPTVESYQCKNGCQPDRARLLELVTAPAERTWY